MRLGRSETKVFEFLWHGFLEQEKKKSFPSQNLKRPERLRFVQGSSVLQPKEEDRKIPFYCPSPSFAACVQLRVQSLSNLVSLKPEEDFAYSAL